MKVLLHPLFLVSTGIFLVHLVMERVLQLNTGIAGRYLDNLLCMPIVLSFFLAERKWLHGSSYELPTVLVLVATIYIAAVSELLFPAISSSFTADWLDVIFYALGSVVFLFVRRNGSLSQSKSSIHS